MCCRLVLTINEEVKAEIIDAFHLAEPVLVPDFNSYNVAPGAPVPVVYQSNAIVMENMEWGFVPIWSEKSGQILPNARIETVGVKPTFKGAFQGQRCIIPANGYYEWKKLDDARLSNGQGSKQPYYIFKKDRGVLAFAGLYQEVEEDGKKINRFTILTQQSQGRLTEIHDRMPVVVPREMVDLWLDDGELPADFISNLIKRNVVGVDEMDFYPVDSAVGNVKNDHKGLVESV